MRPAMKLELPPLPYAEGALEPHVSARTMSFHHGKHHKAYVDKTKTLVAGTDLEGRSVEEIIEGARARKDQKLLNQAGQVWNHGFFWQCMTPGGGKPSAEAEALIRTGFDSLAAFKEAFRKEAVDHFASGWAWLCADADKVVVTSLHDGDTPVGGKLTPLLTCDVWEHAYYLDYQNERPKFVDAFLEHLIDWDFVLKNWKAR
jgi:Fe-Mn family superoxide dismutase